MSKFEVFDNGVEISRVVSFTVKNEGVVITEECDRYYFSTLDKKEFQKFINALQSLHDSIDSGENEEVTITKDKNNKVVIKKGDKTIAMQG